MSNNSPWIDQKYIKFILPRLNLGEQVSSDNYIARCPICGDSQRNKYKRRFYINRHKGDYMCSCFNCDYHNSFSNFLKDMFPEYYAEYKTEKFKEGHIPTTEHKNTPAPQKVNPSLFESKKKITNYVPVQESPLAVQYLTYRQVPQDKWKYFVHSFDYQELIKSTGYKEYEKVQAVPRLVLPLLDENKQLSGFQGRAYDTKSVRYSNISLKEHMMFIPPDLDRTKPIYVTEGIFDALMLPNSVAVLNSTLTRAQSVLPNCELIYVPDNEPYSVPIMTQLQKCVDTKQKVFIPDDTMPTKDLNEWVMSGTPIETVLEYVQSRTFKHPMSLLQYKKYKKC